MLRDAGVADLVISKDMPVDRRNRVRQRMILSGDYDSRFLIGLTVVLTWPSAASVKNWSGGAGVNKLVGREALRRLLMAERNRLDQTIRSFIGKRKGAVVTFQREAWETLRTPENQPFAEDKVKAGELVGETAVGKLRIPLFGVPATRLSGPATRVLGGVVQRI